MFFRNIMLTRISVGLFDEQMNGQTDDKSSSHISVSTFKLN